MFFFVNNSIVKPDNIMGDLYIKYKDSDGFLYIYYCQQQTFGFKKWLKFC